VGRGGNGGRGGDGCPPGASGSGSAEAVATPGASGAGNPEGPPGEVARTEPGIPLGSGDHCDCCQPGEFYNVLLATYERAALLGYRDWAGVETRQDLGVAPDFTVGGENNEPHAGDGQAMTSTPNGSILWFINFREGIYMYHNPVGTGDRAPDVAIEKPGESLSSLWYDPMGDTLYCTSRLGFIYAWDNASAIAASRAPDRTISFPGNYRITSITGAPGADPVFILRDNKLSSIDNLATRDGQIQFDRTVTSFSWTATGLAYLPDADSLFVDAGNGGGSAVIARVPNASAADGDAPFDAIVPQGMAGHAMAMYAFEHTDLLFVGMDVGDVMLLNNVSALPLNPVPTQQERLYDGMFAMYAWAGN